MSPQHHLGLGPAGKNFLPRLNNQTETKENDPKYEVRSQKSGDGRRGGGRKIDSKWWIPDARNSLAGAQWPG